MKNFIVKPLLFAIFCIGITQMVACKSKTAATTADTTATTDTATAVAAAPVTISPDSTLTANVKDATKDFPGVKAAVNDGEVTLTGALSRERLPKLMMSLNSLHPKKIINQLTINK